MPSNPVQPEKSLIATNPAAWEAAMGPMAPVRVKEVLGRQFSAKMRLFELPRTAMFRLQLSRANVVAPAGLDFVSVNIIANGRLRIAGPKGGGLWESGTSHVVNHKNSKFDFTTDEQLDSTVFFFQKPLLQEYAHKFYGGKDIQSLNGINADLNLNSSAGDCFTRYAMFIWQELKRGGAFLQSELATKEIEDSLWALLLSAIDSTHGESGPRLRGGYWVYVKPAEEFILGRLQSSICVADIAAAVGVSVPTLNRAFRECHGIGPKAFLKQRRLERVRSELQQADVDGATVTEIATKYAFWHLSQFAADYKNTFHESPSETLRFG